MDAELPELWPEIEGESGMVTVVGVAGLHVRLEAPASMQ